MIDSAWLDSFIAQQDYLWFLALLAWTAVAALLVWRRRGWAAWQAGAIVSGVATAVVEMAWHVSPPRDFSHESDGWEWALVLAGAIAPAALAWSAGTRIGSRPLRHFTGVVTGGILAAVLVWRHAAPVAGGSALVIFGLMAALAILRPSEKQETGAARWAVLLLALQPALASYGPLAAAGGEIRRWVELSHFGVLAAVLQIANAVVLRWAQWPTEATALAFFDRRELRRVGIAVGLWLTVGLALATWSGRDARRNYEVSLLARARSGLAAISVGDVAELLGSSFRLGEETGFIQPSGRVSISRRVSSLAESRVYKELRIQLGKIEQTNPEIRWAQLLTIKQGSLIGVAFSPRVPIDPNFVPVAREATAEDYRVWTEKGARIEAPMITTWGQLVRASVPIIGSEQQMLGWLALDFGVADWLSVQARARFQAFAIVALGVVLAILFVVQRLRSLEREAALRAARIAADSERVKTAFLAKVSHELRTPIQSILGYSELLRNAPLAEPHRGRLEALHMHGDLMVRLVNDLIDLSALQAGAFRLVPAPGALAELVRDTVESLQPRAIDKGLKLVCRIQTEGSDWLEFDAQRFRQVLLNLVGNALKFTAHGRVDVLLKIQPGEPGMAQCELSVRDTGPGIPPAEQARLFQPFSRIDPQPGVEGVGLGLALSAALCRNMDGSLSVTSDGQTGATFTARCSLPVAQVSVTKQVSAVTSALCGRRILVADDNTLVRDLFVAFLREQGATVEGVANGIAALDRCRTNDYDALVLDLCMPGADGLEVARRLRVADRSSSIRIVGVSAQADAVDRVRALAAGMNEFLIKPVRLEALARAVEPRSDAKTVAIADEPALRARLWAEFDRELPTQLAGLEHAAARRDWAALRARAHYLKNSADILGWDELRGLLLGLDERARMPGSGVVQPLLDEIRRVLIRRRIEPREVAREPSVQTKSTVSSKPDI